MQVWTLASTLSGLFFDGGRDGDAGNDFLQIAGSGGGSGDAVGGELDFFGAGGAGNGGEDGFSGEVVEDVDGPGDGVGGADPNVIGDVGDAFRELCFQGHELLGGEAGDPGGGFGGCGNVHGGALLDEGVDLAECVGGGVEGFPIGGAILQLAGKGVGCGDNRGGIIRGAQGADDLLFDDAGGFGAECSGESVDGAFFRRRTNLGDFAHDIAEAFGAPVADGGIGASQHDRFERRIDRKGFGLGDGDGGVECGIGIRTGQKLGEGPQLTGRADHRGNVLVFFGRLHLVDVGEDGCAKNDRIGALGSFHRFGIVERITR